MSIARVPESFFRLFLGSWAGQAEERIAMLLYLIRHGIAEDHHPKGDRERALTKLGIEKTSEVARKFRKKVDGMEAILYSPYRRAKETAEIFQGEFQAPSFKECPELQAHLSVEGILPLLEDWGRDFKSLALVAHEPNLSLLLGYILTGRNRPIAGFKKVGIACVEWHGIGQSELLYLLTPKLIL